MAPPPIDDAVLRENRRAVLARRLISHGVRTKIISRLTDLTRNRLATLRRRLMVPDKTRRRGPTRTSLEVFLGNPRARTEGAALVALFWVFEIPIVAGAPVLPRIASLDYGERLCEAYEAFCACYPRTVVELEDLILLRIGLAKGDAMQLGQCRTCKCYILVDRFDGNRECWHCGRN